MRAEILPRSAHEAGCPGRGAVSALRKGYVSLGTEVLATCRTAYPWGCISPEALPLPETHIDAHEMAQSCLFPLWMSSHWTQAHCCQVKVFLPRIILAFSWLLF